MKRERVVISQQVGTCLFDIHVHTILDKMVNPPITGKHFLLMSQEVQCISKYLSQCQRIPHFKQQIKYLD